MGVLKDKYEISVWGDQTITRKNATLSNNVYTLTYLNYGQSNTTAPIEILTKEEKSNSTLILPNTRDFTLTVGNNSYTINLAQLADDFSFGRATYNTSTQILTKTHGFLEITREDMKKISTTSRAAPSGYEWYSYSGIKDLVDSSKRGSSQCSFNYGNYSSSNDLAEKHAFINSNGYSLVQFGLQK